MKKLLSCLLSTLVILSAGCHSNSSIPFINGTKHIDPLYYIIGSRPGVRWPNCGDEICTFYDDETEVASLYKEFLLELQQELFPDERVEVRIDDTYNWISFHSTAVSDLVTSFYEYKLAKMTSLVLAEEDWKPGYYYFISDEKILVGSDLQKLSYLSGIFSRFSEGSTLRFEGDQNRFFLVLELLNMFKCKDVSVNMYLKHGIQISTVSFTPSPIIKQTMTYIELRKKTANQRVDLTR